VRLHGHRRRLGRVRREPLEVREHSGGSAVKRMRTTRARTVGAATTFA
jgi:hypothetical protein